MKNPKDNLADRRIAASESKAALLNAHRAAVEAAEPTRIARQEERVARAAAKEERQADRVKGKREEQERLDLEQAEAAAVAAAEIAAHELDMKDDASRAVLTEADKKAERDRRYADRKARQR
ncbi:hypothetical protein C5F48_02500 [Cereibacter changlensis JA139]|uniref:Uncharacterized protein n=1 Tax=Cereibacter changlensis JA139 TaxID=1188249 RepID=A0A2T4JZK4_9RHOB|nr:DUF6481 family protein [Cereibacter changlensis]PTE23351.1 hypothetical protein C5F48_02500 [Cereibacter changlensis JA139]